MADSASADPRIGSEIAGYRIERLLGRGGMSVVYLAHDPRLDRRVALKLLAPELAEDERFRERFLRESQFAASLDHPNVIPIFEAGEADGVLFIAMRYVEGTDLKRLLAAEGRLDPAWSSTATDRASATARCLEEVLMFRFLCPPSRRAHSASGVTAGSTRLACTRPATPTRR
jgi:serine/threonine protein kinase